MIRKSLSWFVTFFGGILILARACLDVVGYSTFPEDFRGLQNKLLPIAEYVSEIPGLVFYGVSIVVLLVGLSLHVSPQRWRHLGGFATERENNPTSTDLVSVRTAAAAMYERASPRLRDWATTIMSVDAEIDGVPTDPGAYFVEVIKSLAAHQHLKVLGRRAPDLVHEEIPADYFDNTTLIDGASIRVAGQSRVDWYDLKVSRAAALAGVAEYERDEYRHAVQRRP